MNYLLNHWKINSLENTIENTSTNELFKVEPRSMAVLLLLIEKTDQVVTREEFTSEIWNGRITVEESLTRCISELRKVLEEDPKQPVYIKTIHKKGYKLLVEARKLESSTSPTPETSKQRKGKNTTFVVFGAVVIVLVLSVLLFQNGIRQESSNDKPTVAKSEIDDVRQLLLKSNPPVSSLTWRNTANDTVYSITSRNVLDGQTAETRMVLQLIDRYDHVIWEASTVSGKHKANVEALLEVLRLLQLHKDAPELALLPSQLRSVYKRALYLIDLRGPENLETAIGLLDNILNQQPDFVMALIQKAVAARTLSFYKKTLEQRRQQVMQYELLIKQAKTVAPDHPVVKSLTSKIDLEQKNWFEYESFLVAAVEYSPACTICIRNLAEYYLNLGFYQKAESLVSQHIDYFPLSMMMHSFLGQIYNMQGVVEGAEQQVNIINALGRTEGSDALAMEINIAMSEGDIEKYRTLAQGMVKRHPGYKDQKAFNDALLRGDVQAAKAIVESMPVMDFNLAVSVGKYPQLIARIEQNLGSGQLRDLSLVHGWLNPDTHISKYYREGILALKNRPEISQLFEEIGLFDHWREYRQWPDYCHLDQYRAHRPAFCPP